MLQTLSSSWPLAGLTPVNLCLSCAVKPRTGASTRTRTHSFNKTICLYTEHCLGTEIYYSGGDLPAQVERDPICSQSLISLEQLLSRQLTGTGLRAKPKVASTNRSLLSFWLPVHYVHDRKDCYINKHNDFHSIPLAIFIQTT